MRRISIYAGSVLLAAAVLAGCGSSSKSTSASAPSSSTANAAATSSSAANNPYGSYGSSTSSAQPASASSSPGGAVVLVTTKSSKLGTVLAGRKHLTLYMFEADKGGASACSGACAASWPPLIGTPHAAGKAVAADLGTITRSDGSRQVTYKGHPLYYYTKDGDSGDAYGEGVNAFGASWYVIAPSGNKIDNS